MRALRIREAYLISGGLMIKSQITLKDDAILEIKIMPIIKRTITRIRGNPSLSELRELLRIKRTDILQVNIRDVMEVNAYTLRKGRRDLRNLFDADDNKPYLMLLDIGLAELRYRIILNYNDGVRLKKALSSLRGWGEGRFRSFSGNK